MSPIKQATEDVKLLTAHIRKVASERDTALAQLAEAKAEAELAKRLVRETTAPESWNLMFDELVQHKAALDETRRQIAEAKDTITGLRRALNSKEQDLVSFKSELSTLRASIAADFVKREDVENLISQAEAARLLLAQCPFIREKLKVAIQAARTATATKPTAD